MNKLPLIIFTWYQSFSRSEIDWVAATFLISVGDLIFSDIKNFRFDVLIFVYAASTSAIPVSVCDEEINLHSASWELYLQVLVKVYVKAYGEVFSNVVVTYQFSTLSEIERLGPFSREDESL